GSAASTLLALSAVLVRAESSLIALKPRGGKCTCAESGGVISSHLRYAARRHSSRNSGSFLMAESRRIVSSLSPGGNVTDSISVTKPAEYSRSRKESSWSVALLLIQ